jgi:organic hydroperoxide reductase OsmC/OhrA
VHRVKEHRYEATVRWTGAREGTTSTFGAYSREHEAVVEGKPVLRLSAGGTFLGDDALHNTEDLLLIALSGCHLLTYLAKCARAGLSVLSYEDQASGTMTWDGETYRFSEVVLRPRVVIEAGGDLALAEELLHRSNELCFIARSVNFSVRHEPEVTAGAAATS